MANTYTLISSNVLTSNTASVTFSSIPNTYSDLILRMSTRIYVDGSTTLYPFNLTLNSTGTTLFSETLIRQNSTTIQSTRQTAQPNMYFNYADAELATADTFASNEVYVPNYASAAYKPFLSNSHSENNTSGVWLTANAGLYSSTSAVTSITLWNASTFYFVPGSSFYLYGIKNS
jgi:hypothetical protein